MSRPRKPAASPPSAPTRSATPSKAPKQRPPARRVLARDVAVSADDPLILRRLTAAFRKGLTTDLAAGVAGVNPTTVRKWLAQGDEDAAAGRDTAFARLVLEVAHAEAAHASALIDRVTKASRHEWRAGAWILERRYGYGSRANVAVTGATDEHGVGSAIRVDVDLSKLTIEQLRGLSYGDEDDEDPR